MTGYPLIDVSNEVPLGVQANRPWTVLVEANEPADSTVVVRGNSLVRMTERGEFEAYNDHSLKDELSAVAVFAVKKGEGWMPRNPSDIARTLRARDSVKYPGAPRVDRLVGVLVRYADDRVVLCRSEREARAALRAAGEILAGLGLGLDPEKTRIVDLRECREGFDFLGCHFRARVSGRLLERGVRRYHLQRWPSRRAMQRIRARVGELTDRRRCAGVKDVRDVIAGLNPVLRGWGNHFRTGNAADKFIQIDRRVARRLGARDDQAQGSRRLCRAGRSVDASMVCRAGPGSAHGRDSLSRGRVGHARMIIGEPCAGGSSRHGCGPAGESPATSVVHVGREATPPPGPGSRPGDARCERPGGWARECRGRSGLGGRASAGARG